MPRPVKRRKVCCLPDVDSFGPRGKRDNIGEIIMTVDEYETIRLIDLDGMTQQQCAEQMKIARTTVQRIYDDARKKIADAIINGKGLVIHGGNYSVCKGRGAGCGKTGCRRKEMEKIEIGRVKSMRIALPVDGNNDGALVSANFGRAPFFAVYGPDENKVEYIRNLAVNSTGGAGVQAAQCVVDSGADTAIVPRLGQNAAEVLKAAGINVYKSEGEFVKGNLDKLAAGELEILKETHEGFHNGGK